MIHRTALFVGVSLAAAGIAMLIGLGDTTASEAIIGSVRLWPLAIVALGVGLLVRRTRFAVVGALVAATLAGLVIGGAVVAAPNLDTFCTDRDVAGAPIRTGTLVGPATVDLSLACGDVDISTIDGVAWELRTLDLGSRSAIVTEAGDVLRIRSTVEDWHAGLGPHGDAWQLALPRDVLLDLVAKVNAGRGQFDLVGATLGSIAVQVNAGDARLDLGGATVTEIDVEVNVGSATVLLPSGSALTGRLEVAAGAIEICAPPDLGLRVRGDADFGDTTFNGLLRVGDAWETPNLSTATHVTELDVSAQAGSVVVNPAGGCK